MRFSTLEGTPPHTFSLSLVFFSFFSLSPENQQNIRFLEQKKKTSNFFFKSINIKSISKEHSSLSLSLSLSLFLFSLSSFLFLFVLITTVTYARER